MLPLSTFAAQIGRHKFGAMKYKFRPPREIPPKMVRKTGPLPKPVKRYAARQAPSSRPQALHAKRLHDAQHLFTCQKHASLEKGSICRKTN